MPDPTLGVVFRPQSPPEQLREIVLAAETAGVEELWLWEDCFLEGGLTTATAALAWTERLRVGVGLLPVPLRNTALAAMEIATLARLFPGRFSAGIGHGVLSWMGQVGAAASSPMGLLREYTVALHDLLQGRTVTIDGRFVHLDAVALDWPPDQVPPLLVGARGPRTLRLAGELADGVILDSGVSRAAIRESVAWVAEGRAGAGRSGGPQVVVYVGIPAGTGGAEIERTVAELAEAGATSVVLEPPAEAPDLRPLISACAAWAAAR